MHTCQSFKLQFDTKNMERDQTPQITSEFLGVVSVGFPGRYKELAFNIRDYFVRSSNHDRTNLEFLQFRDAIKMPYE